MASVTHSLSSRFGYAYPAPATAATVAPIIASTDAFTEVKYDIGRQEIVFADTLAACPVHAGDWVAMILTGK